MSVVTFPIASERDDRKSCSSDETKNPEARIVGDPRAPVVRFGEVERAESGDDGTLG